MSEQSADQKFLLRQARLVAIVIAVTTIIAAHNLPGLLEVILLNRLPMDPGARYAYSTVCRYAITAIGIIIVFNTIGIKCDSGS